MSGKSDIDLDAVIAKIKKLRAMTVENGATIAEEANAAAIVQRMLSRYQIAIADIENSDVGEDIITKKIQMDTVYASGWKRFLLHSLSEPFTCKSFFGPIYSKARRREVINFLVVGHRSDVITVKWLFESLSYRLCAMADCAGRSQGYRGRSLVSFKNSYVIGASIEINARLMVDQNGNDGAEHDESCTALTVMKSHAVEEFAAELFTNRGKPGTVTCKNQDGFGAGRTAGRSVSLAHEVESSSTPLLLDG